MDRFIKVSVQVKFVFSFERSGDRDAGVIESVLIFVTYFGICLDPDVSVIPYEQLLDLFLFSRSSFSAIVTLAMYF